ncbi:MAG: hypothetical protein RIB80_16025 [Rhodospirillales bacterium]
MKFKNPENGYEEKILGRFHWLWCFLWTPIYYLAKGIWIHAVLSFFLSWVLGAYTFLISTFVIAFIYACINRSVVEKHYLRKGWTKVEI